jgi:general stress protein 26
MELLIRVARLRNAQAFNAAVPAFAKQPPSSRMAKLSPDEEIPVSDDDNDQQKHLDFIWKAVEDMTVGMLTTRAGDNLRGRPMSAIPRRDDNVIWFLSDGQSHKEAELRSDPRACVLFSDPKNHTYVSLSGEVHISRDRELIKSLWNVAVDAYWPDGPDESDVLLLGFRPQEAEYWDAPSNPLVLAIKFVQAKITRERPELGDNARVLLQ